MDPQQILRAGGIAPSSTKESPKDIRCADVDARVFEHPALPGRKVVRLVATPIAPGVDVEMETLGFEKKTVHEGLGKQRYRALGFPGWPLVHDPARAKFALEVMKDFKKAAQQAKSKPGHARDAFAAIGDRLARSVPHFLPSFWEEAGRTFLAEESTSFAAQCFEKARSAEKEHNLQVDEDVRSAVYLEFALGGAVAAKSLAGYAKELAEAYGPKDAYERYLELAIRRVLGGMQPWTGVAKDLRALAKAAKLDVDAEDRRFLAEVLDAPAMVRAPGELWTAYRASIVALAAEKPAIRTRLRHLFPKPPSGATGFPAAWLALLEESGALAGVIDASDSAAEPAGGAASFIAKLLQFLDRQADALPLLEKSAARLIAEGAPVALAPATQWRCKLDLDVTERALSLKLPVADPPPAAQFDLSKFDLDPVTVEADPRFSGKLLDAVEGVLGNADFEARAKGKVGLGKARSAWLERELDRLGRGALPGLARTTTRLGEKASAQLFAEIPGSNERVEKTDVALALARTLRGGLVAELSWPIFEETLAKHPGMAIVGAYPYPVLKSSSKAIALSADAVIAEHDLVVPPKAQVHHVVYCDGDLLVPFWAPDQGLRAYWASSPHEPFAVSGYFHWYGDDLPTSAAIEGVGTTFGHRAIKRGDRDLQPGFRHIVSDGRIVWFGEWEGGRWVLKELDPRTGSGGRASWPKLVEEASARDDGLRITSVGLAPLPPSVSASPLGSKDGLVGAFARGPKQGEGGKLEVETIDGRRWEGHTTKGPAPVALVNWPGDTVPRALLTEHVWTNGRQQVIRIVGGDGYVASAIREAAWASRGFPTVPPLSLWSFLRTRDEKGSLALRALDDDKARRLIEATREEKDGEKLTIARAAVKQILPEITADPLIEAVAAATFEAVVRGSKIASLVAERRSPGAASAPSTTLMDRPVLDAMAMFVASSWSNSPLSEEIVAVGQALIEGTPTKYRHSAASWHDWVGRLRGIALLAASTATSEVHRKALVELLQVFRATPFVRDGLKMRRIVGSVASSSPVRPLEGPSWVASYDKSRYFFRGAVQGESWSVSGLELSTDGTFRLPPGVTITWEYPVETTGDAAWLDAFFGLLAEKGPRPFVQSEVDALATATGLTRPEATLLLNGLPKVSDYSADFLGKELREKLGGLKMPDAKVARDTFRPLERPKLLVVLARSAPADPAQIWGDLSQLGGAAWNGIFGQRAALRAELVIARERDVDPPLAASLVLSALQSPKESKLLAVRELAFADLFAYSNPPPSDSFRHQTAESFALLIPWMFHSLPVGDPDRARIPALHAAVLEALKDPKLSLPLATGYVEEKHKKQLEALVEAIGGKTDPIAIGNERSIVARDNGGLVGLTLSNGMQARFGFRPALVDDGHMAHRLAKDSGFALHRYETLSAVSFLRSPGLAAMVARIAESPVPEGGWEANPDHGSKALVDDVMAKKKLSREAAIHYLQLLALQEPTLKAVITWNGWKTGVYKETCIELAKQKLVVEGKRERASREVFLPGGWEKSAKGKNLPSETWKRAFYLLPNGSPLSRILPLRPHHQLFEAAWTRVLSGDAPKFDEV
jgi:hypothetical protein